MKPFVLIVPLALMGCSHASGYQPWVTDEYFFHKLGEKRSYKIVPARWSRPEIVLYDSSCELPGNLFSVLANGEPANQFLWDISVQIFRDGRVIENKKLIPISALVSGGSLECIQSISFEAFESISGEVFPKEATITVTVNKTDPRYSEPNDAITFGIRNSPVH